MQEILGTYKVIWDLFLGYWWLILPIILFFILKKIWMKHIKKEFIKGLQWTTLEIRIPRNVVKTPKAMEQFFTGIHVSKKDPDFKEKYFKGEIPPWHSLEIFGKSGSIHFLMRVQEKFRNLFESQIYAQYSQAEINETEDYVPLIPNDIPNKEYDIALTELMLLKEDAYPIRTYPVFFEEKDPEERSDPLAGLFEFLSTLKPNENVGIQFIISPCDDKWKEEGEALVGKMIGREVKLDKKQGLIVKEIGSWTKSFGDGIRELFFGGSSEIKKEDAKEQVAYLSPGQKDVALAVEKNIAKLGFKVLIRFAYWAPKDIFSKDRLSSIAGFFVQFNTQNLNGFKPNKKIFTKYKIFKKSREELQKRERFDEYKKRKLVPKRAFVLSTEELATVFHIPNVFVESETMEKLEAKKGSPPSGLPVEL
ncbi:hypothetical protein KKA23_03325 [Patescibacteria group bacterium]|nr:hypothetical protein [Patescibacteria group bacterium]